MRLFLNSSHILISTIATQVEFSRCASLQQCISYSARISCRTYGSRRVYAANEKSACTNRDILNLKPQHWELSDISDMMWRPIFFVVCLIIFGDAQRRNFSAFPCPTKCYCFKRTVRCMRIEMEEIPKTAVQTNTL